jgi:predicted O-methyltransferase YrrM
MSVFRDGAKSLALAIPPVRHLYDSVLEANAYNATLRKRWEVVVRERNAVAEQAAAAKAKSATLNQRVAVADAENAKLKREIEELRNCAYSVPGSGIRSAGQGPRPRPNDYIPPDYQIISGNNYILASNIVLDQVPAKPRFIGHHACYRHVFFFPLFHLLAQRFPNEALRVLEVGSLFGASALSMAAAAQSANRKDVDFSFVDLFEIDICGLIHHIQVFRYNISRSPYARRSTIHIGASQQILPLLSDQAYHLVYIDADHTFEGASYDFNQARRLVRDRGIISGDDLELTLGECDASFCEAHRNVDDPVIDPLSGTLYHAGVTTAVAAEFGDARPSHGFFAYERCRDSSGVTPVDLDELMRRTECIPLLTHLPKDASQSIAGFLANHYPTVRYGSAGDAAAA